MAVDVDLFKADLKAASNAQRTWRGASLSAFELVRLLKTIHDDDQLWSDLASHFADDHLRGHAVVNLINASDIVSLLAQLGWAPPPPAQHLVASNLLAPLHASYVATTDEARRASVAEARMGLQRLERAIRKNVGLYPDGAGEPLHRRALNGVVAAARSVTAPKTKAGWALAGLAGSVIACLAAHFAEEHVGLAASAVVEWIAFQVPAGLDSIESENADSAAHWFVRATRAANNAANLDVDGKLDDNTALQALASIAQTSLVGVLIGTGTQAANEASQRLGLELLEAMTTGPRDRSTFQAVARQCSDLAHDASPRYAAEELGVTPATGNAPTDAQLNRLIVEIEQRYADGVAAAELNAMRQELGLDRSTEVPKIDPDPDVNFTA